MRYLDWHVGMKVVCVGCEGTPKPKGFWQAWQKHWGIIKPQRREAYTIRDMRMGSDGDLRVRLVEIVNPVIEYNDAPPQEPWFFGRAFRPVQTRKTDISVFQQLLAPSKIKAREDA